jgi:O-antigen/teichoic acid export membrane protein
VARDVIRFAVALLPGVAIVYGCAPELVARIFGPAFLGAAPLLGPLFAGGIALCILVVSVAILTAAEHTAPVSRLGLLLIASSAVGHLITVPRLGAIGAAMVTAVTSFVVSLIALWLAHRVWSLGPSPTVVRAAVVGVGIYFAGGAVTTTSWWGLSAKLVLLSLAAAGGLILLGELSAADRARLRPYLPAWFQSAAQRS